MIQVGEALQDGVELLGYTTWGPIDLVQPRLQKLVNVMVSSTLIEMMMVVVAWHVIRKIHFLGISLLSKVMVPPFVNRKL